MALPLSRKLSSACTEAMRSCRRFLAGIPHLTVDHPRGTHPSATPCLLRDRTFDLHVLGTPPAFILSQDQTRHPICVCTVALARGGHVHVCVELRSRPSTVVAWLVRRKTLILRPCDRRSLILTGTARLQTVAVLLSTLQLSRFILLSCKIKITSRAGSALYCFFIKAEKVGCYPTPQRAKSTRVFSFQGVHV